MVRESRFTDEAGKEIGFDAPHSALQILSVYLVESGIVLGQEPIHEKTNEIYNRQAHSSLPVYLLHYCVVIYSVTYKIAQGTAGIQLIRQAGQTHEGRKRENVFLREVWRAEALHVQSGIGGFVAERSEKLIVFLP